MKKLLSVMLAVMMVFMLAACGEQEGEQEQSEKAFKVGMVCIGDTNEGYTSAHVDGLNKACEELGVSDVVYKYNCGEGGEAVQNALEDLVEEGCDLIISNSYGHQSYTLEAAKANPDITFVASTGDNAASSGLENLSNAFPSTYESRYVAGVVAGMKLAELVENGKLTEENYDENGNIIVGYVSAYPYAECVSGFTSYFLGIKSIVNNVTMHVTYTNNWSDATLEKAGAESLIAKGAVIISQHADTVGAPSAVEAAHVEDGKEVYCVGYNISMLEVAPESCLTSATNNWSVAYKYIVSTAMNKAKVEEWNGGFTDSAVNITELGKNCAEGTAEKVAEVEAALKDGTLHVFDINTFTVNGQTVSSNEECVDGFYLDAIGGDAVYDGYFHESEYRSAPYFAAIIDGIVPIE